MYFNRAYVLEKPVMFPYGKNTQKELHVMLKYYYIVKQ